MGTRVVAVDERRDDNELIAAYDGGSAPPTTAIDE